RTIDARLIRNHPFGKNILANERIRKSSLIRLFPLVGLPDRVEKEQSIRFEASLDAIEVRRIVFVFDMLEHADRNDAVERTGALAIILDDNLHGKSVAPFTRMTRLFR